MTKRDKIKPWIDCPISFYYPTSDDWHPNFPRDTVLITMYVYYNPDNIRFAPNGLIRIVVSGADDTLMEMDIRLPVSEYPAKIKELTTWLENKLPNPLTKKWLLDEGFRYA